MKARCSIRPGLLLLAAALLLATPAPAAEPRPGSAAGPTPTSVASASVAQPIAAAETQMRALVARFEANRGVIQRLGAMDAVDQLWWTAYTDLRSRSTDAERPALVQTPAGFRAYERRSAARLRALLPARGGWFRISDVGARTAAGAFRIVQHSEDVALEREVLARMAPLIGTPEIDPSTYAVLYDRLAIVDGRPQRYATGHDCVDGRWTTPATLEDPAGLGARRAAMKLPPLADDLARRNRDGVRCRPADARLPELADDPRGLSDAALARLPHSGPALMALRRRLDAQAPVVAEIGGMDSFAQAWRVAFLALLSTAPADGRVRLEDMADPLLAHDRAFAARLARRMPAHGWFRASDIGWAAAAQAFSIVQHSNDLGLQHDVLRRMAPLLATREADGGVYAALFDRVAVADGRPQRYATQGTDCRDGQIVAPADLEDPPGLDQRRQAVGLPPLAEYLTQLNARYGGCTDAEIARIKRAPTPGPTGRR